jgi:sigma-B regulation protein RsbU (phosphoserine phosphatase)
MTPDTQTAIYPWQSQVVFVAELDGHGTILRSNAALDAAGGFPLQGAPAAGIFSAEHRAIFERLLAELPTEGWSDARLSVLDAQRGSAEDRWVWIRRLPGERIELIAEPTWSDRERLLEQVLQLNDDLIATQRTSTRRQRDLEIAQGEAARSAGRVRQLEAILLAGLSGRSFEETLALLLSAAQSLLPGDRADILLIDETTGQLVHRAGHPDDATARPAGGAGLADAAVLESVAETGRGRRVAELEPAPEIGVDQVSGVAREQDAGAGERARSMIAVSLRIEGQVAGVLAVYARGSDCFSDDDLRLLEVVGERVALAIGQAQLRERERRLAETLQRTLLPQRLPSLPGALVAARYRPHSTSVGGDFYDAVSLPGGRIGVAIGDVTGKGLRAAAAMSRLRSALHAYALDADGPAEALTRLGRLAENDGAMATALYLILDPSSGEVRMASAGHLPPVRLAPDGEAEYVDVFPALSPPLGVPVDHRAELAISLSERETLLLYTDGLVERSRNIDEGMRRLVGTAAELAGAPPNVVCDQLLERLTPTGRYRDDVALLAIRRLG